MKTKEQIKKVYEPRVGAPFQKGDAQAIGEFIEKNKSKNTAEILSLIKNNKNHIIYKCIEWDDKKASDAYRLHQVRNIINHIEIRIIRLGNETPISLNVTIRAFQSVKTTTPTGMLCGERIYVSAEDGMTNPLYRIQIIQRAKTELLNWTQRYEQYQELETIVKTLQTLIHD